MLLHSPHISKAADSAEVYPAKLMQCSGVDLALLLLSVTACVLLSGLHVRCPEAQAYLQV